VNQPQFSLIGPNSVNMLGAQGTAVAILIYYSTIVIYCEVRDMLKN